MDIGCGRGAVLFPVATAVGNAGHVVGIDLSRRMIELVGARVHELGLANVELHVMDAVAQPSKLAELMLFSRRLWRFSCPNHS